MAMKRIGALAAALALAGATAAVSEEMVAYTVVDDSMIEQPLTDQAGDPSNGRKVFTGRKLGNCLACHQVTSLMEDFQFHGEVGPTLDGVMDRYSTPELRLQVVNSKVINPDTIMPAFYRNSGFNRVNKKFTAKSILTAQQVEDVLAYLATDDFKE